MIPDWWGFLLLALAAYRTWRLLALDTILDQPRARLKHGQDFLGCPWCSGAWIAAGWWAAWWAWPHNTTVVAVPFALSLIIAALYRVEE